MAMFRKQAVAHRYETGWAQLEPDIGISGWSIALVTLGNILAAILLAELVR